MGADTIHHEIAHQKIIAAHSKIVGVLTEMGIKGAPALEQLVTFLVNTEKVDPNRALEAVKNYLDLNTTHGEKGVALDHSNLSPTHNKLKLADRLFIPLNVAVVIVSLRFLEANKKEVSFDEFNASLKRFLQEKLFIPDDAISGITREHIANNLRKRRAHGAQVVTVSPFNITNDEIRQAYKIVNEKNKERLPEIDEISAALKEVREGAETSIDQLRRRCNELKLPFKTLKPVEKQNQKIVAYYGEYCAKKGVRPNTKELERFIRKKGERYSSKEIRNAIYSKRRHRKEGEDDFKLRLGFTDNEIRTAHERALKKMTDRRLPSPKEVKQALPKKLKGEQISLDQIRRRCNRLVLGLRTERRFEQKFHEILREYREYRELSVDLPSKQEFLAFLQSKESTLSQGNITLLLQKARDNNIEGVNEIKFRNGPPDKVIIEAYRNASELTTDSSPSLRAIRRELIGLNDGKGVSLDALREKCKSLNLAIYTPPPQREWINQIARLHKSYISSFDKIPTKREFLRYLENNQVSSSPDELKQAKQALRRRVSHEYYDLKFENGFSDADLIRAYQLTLPRTQPKLPNVSELLRVLKLEKPDELIGLKIIKKKAKELGLGIWTVPRWMSLDQQLVDNHKKYLERNGDLPSFTQFLEFLPSELQWLSKSDLLRAQQRIRERDAKAYRLKFSSFLGNSIILRAYDIAQGQDSSSKPKLSVFQGVLREIAGGKELPTRALLTRSRALGLEFDVTRIPYRTRAGKIKEHHQGFLAEFGIMPRLDEFLNYLKSRGVIESENSLKKIIYAVNKQRILDDIRLDFRSMRDPRLEIFCERSDKNDFINDQYNSFFLRHGVEPSIFEMLTKAQVVFPDITEAELQQAIKGRLMPRDARSGNFGYVSKAYDSGNNLIRFKSDLSSIYKDSKGVFDLRGSNKGAKKGINEKRVVECIDDLNRLHGGIRLPFLLVGSSFKRFSDKDSNNSGDQEGNRHRAIRILQGSGLLSGYRPTSDSPGKAFSDLLFLTKYLVNLRVPSESAKSNMFEHEEHLFTKRGIQEFSSEPIKEEQGRGDSEVGNQLLEYLHVLKAGIGCRLLTEHAVLENIEAINWASSSIKARQIMVQFMRQNLSRWFSVPFRWL